MSEMMVPIAFFGMILGIVYLSIRKKERMALLQTGKDASIFDSKFGIRGIYSSLKWSIILIGTGVGLFVALLIDEFTDIADEFIYPSMLLIFGGIGLLIFYFIVKGKEDAHQPD